MRVKPCPFAVFDEFGKPADDRVWAYVEVVAAAERERCANVLRYWLVGYNDNFVASHEARCLAHILDGRPPPPGEQQ